MRLRHSDLEAPGLVRRRRGRGFSYTDPSGRAVDHETRERIESMAIPPAWKDVWISPHHNGHIQAYGTDDAGRRQYLYHPVWQEQQAQAKYDRVLDLARQLPAVRRRITRDLRRERLGRERVLAGVLRMLDTGAFRTGGDEYAETYGSYGVSTLERGHVTVRGLELHFVYNGKSGQHQDVTLHDRDLAGLVVALRRARTGSDRLFVYHEHGEWHEVRAAQVNERFKELAGEAFTVKDLRTWQATVRAAIFLAEAPEPASETARRSLLTEVMKRVADDLGNTPAVARSSYVDPRVVERQEQGRTIARPLDRIGSDDLGRPGKRAAIERSVIRLLSRA